MKQQLILTTKVWKAGRYYIAYTPELEVASQGKNREEAEKRLREAVHLVLETAKKMGTLKQLFQELGFIKQEQKWRSPAVLISSLEVNV